MNPTQPKFGLLYQFAISPPPKSEEKIHELVGLHLQEFGDCVKRANPSDTGESLISGGQNRIYAFTGEERQKYLEFFESTINDETVISYQDAEDLLTHEEGALKKLWGRAHFEQVMDRLKSQVDRFVQECWQTGVPIIILPIKLPNRKGFN